MADVCDSSWFKNKISCFYLTLTGSAWLIVSPLHLLSFLSFFQLWRPMTWSGGRLQVGCSSRSWMCTSSGRICPTRRGATPPSPSPTPGPPNSTKVPSCKSWSSQFFSSTLIDHRYFVLNSCCIYIILWLYFK